jgi:hypothetical protein
MSVPSQARGRRRRFTLRSLLIAVVIAAIPLALIANGERRARRRAAAAAMSARQYSVVQEILGQADRFLSTGGGPTNPQPTRSGGRFAGNMVEWQIEVHHMGARPSSSQEVTLIDLRVKGGRDGATLWPIRIEDRGGLDNPKVIEALRTAFAEKKWLYLVQGASVAP